MKLNALIGFLIFLWTMGLVNSAEAVTPEYKVATKDSPPFAYKVEGVWKGLSIDLLNMLAKDIGFTYNLIETKDVVSLIGHSQINLTDLSIAAISILDEREKYVDFSHDYFSTTQGILTKGNGSIFWFIAQRVVAAFVVLILGFYIAGFIVSRLDPNDAIDNIHKGAWFVLVTYTTTGYGDVVPQNAKAKVFAGFIMISSMFLLAAFTSYVTATLTIEKLSTSSITLADLASRTSKVVAIENSSSSKLLSKLDISYSNVKNAAEGKRKVESGKATAFVYDKALLDYMLIKEDNTSLIVHPLDRGVEEYGIVFPHGSELREDFNVAILKIIASPEWRQLTTQYFGN